MTLQPIDHRLRWSRANIPAQYRGLRLEDYHPYDADSEAAKAAATAYVESFPDYLPTGPAPADRGKGLLLIGNPGTGKTLLACIILTEVHLRHRINVRFVAAASYLTALTRSVRLGKDVDRGVPEAVEQYYAIEREKEVVRHRPLLVLDDVGKEHHTVSGFARDTLDTLFRERYADGLPIVLTSNLPPAKWAEVYSPSMRSFLDQAYDRLLLRGPDQRGRPHAGR